MWFKYRFSQCSILLGVVDRERLPEGKLPSSLVVEKPDRLIFPKQFEDEDHGFRETLRGKQINWSRNF